jgi:hypothetical protein
MHSFSSFNSVLGVMKKIVAETLRCQATFKNDHLRQIKMRRYYATKITSNVNIGKDMALFLQYENQKDESNQFMAGMRFFF